MSCSACNTQQTVLSAFLHLALAHNACRRVHHGKVCSGDRPHIKTILRFPSRLTRSLTVSPSTSPGVSMILNRKPAVLRAALVGRPTSCWKGVTWNACSFSSEFAVELLPTPFLPAEKLWYYGNQLAQWRQKALMYIIAYVRTIARLVRWLTEQQHCDFLLALAAQLCKHILEDLPRRPL